MNNETKTFRVECKTQFGNRSGWSFFNRYEAKSKKEAIENARSENWSGGCLSGEGLVWWRAIDESIEQNETCRAWA